MEGRRRMIQQGGVEKGVDGFHVERFRNCDEIDFEIERLLVDLFPIFNFSQRKVN